MTLGRVVAWFAFIVVATSQLPLHAKPSKSLQPVRLRPNTASDPYITAQIQITRLRQTADQLHRLASQPTPQNATAEIRQESRKQQDWLRQAEQRVNALANEWEQQIKQVMGSVARTLDLNTLFETQSTTLQSKLNREILALEVHSDSGRSTRDTARLIIGKMN